MSNTSTRPKSALKEVAKTSTGVEQKGDSIKNSRSSDDLHKRATLSPIHHDITIDEHGGDLKGYGNPNSASNTRRHSFNVDLMQKFKYAMVVTGGRSTILFNWGRAQSEPLLSRPLSSTTYASEQRVQLLPEHTFQKIFSYLTSKEYLTVRLVCRGWRDLVQIVFPSRRLKKSELKTVDLERILSKVIGRINKILITSEQCASQLADQVQLKRVGELRLELEGSIPLIVQTINRTFKQPCEENNRKLSQAISESSSVTIELQKLLHFDQITFAKCKKLLNSFEAVSRGHYDFFSPPITPKVKALPPLTGSEFQRSEIDSIANFTLSISDPNIPTVKLSEETQRPRIAKGAEFAKSASSISRLPHLSVPIVVENDKENDTFLKEVTDQIKKMTLSGIRGTYLILNGLGRQASAKTKDFALRKEIMSLCDKLETFGPTLSLAISRASQNKEDPKLKQQVKDLLQEAKSLMDELKKVIPQEEVVEEYSVKSTLPKRDSSWDLQSLQKSDSFERTSGNDSPVSQIVEKIKKEAEFGRVAGERCRDELTKQNISVICDQLEAFATLLFSDTRDSTFVEKIAHLTILVERLKKLVPDDLNIQITGDTLLKTLNAVAERRRKPLETMALAKSDTTLETQRSHRTLLPPLSKSFDTQKNIPRSVSLGKMDVLLSEQAEKRPETASLNRIESPVFNETETLVSTWEFNASKSLERTVANSDEHRTFGKRKAFERSFTNKI